MERRKRRRSWPRRSKTQKGQNIWVVCFNGRALVKPERRGGVPLRGVTQAQAIRYARALARSNNSELIVQARNGRIRVKDSHGFDSPRRRG